MTDKTRAGGTWRAWTAQRCWTLMVCLIVAAPALQGRELVDRVLAVVSGSIITLSDARAAIELGLVDTHGTRDPVAVALNWLIERRLVLDETRRYETADPDVVGVDAMLWIARRRFPSDASWEAAKRRLGLTDDTIRALVAESLFVEEFLDRRFDAQPAPADSELQAYFDRHRAEFVSQGQPMTFDAARIAVEERVRLERRAQAVKEWVARLRRRADVSELYTPAR